MPWERRLARDRHGRRRASCIHIVRTVSDVRTICTVLNVYIGMYTFNTGLGCLSPNENDQIVRTTTSPITRSGVVITGLDQILSFVPADHESPNADHRDRRECREVVI